MICVNVSGIPKNLIFVVQHIYKKCMYGMPNYNPVLLAYGIEVYNYIT